MDAILLLATFFATCVCTGCGTSGTATVPVHGKVTFDGGAPPAAGTVTFVPITVEEGLPRRPGAGQFGPDGLFRTTSFQPNDGLMPGTYGATVVCWKSNPATSNDPDAFEKLNYVPKDFKAPTVTVDAKSGEVDLVIDVPKKK